MSYCRYSDECDAYIYMNGHGAFFCHISDKVIYRDSNSKFVQELQSISDQCHSSQKDVIKSLNRVLEIDPSFQVDVSAIERLAFEDNHGCDGSLSDLGKLLANRIATPQPAWNN